MKKSTPYLQEAIRIADELVIAPYKQNPRMDLYTGISGICLFLLELYSVTKDAKYLTAFEERMAWVDHYINLNPQLHNAFITGTLGIAYTYLRAFQITKKKEYLDKAVEIAIKATSDPIPNHEICEYINGAAGTLHALLHIYAATQNEIVANNINTYVQYIVTKAQHGPKGLYWDRSHMQMHGLCGFAHGASGVGYTFLELGHYFKNDDYYAIAEAAFTYEDHYYDKQIRNWPDFRVHMYSPNQIEYFMNEYSNGSIKALTTPHDMNAWCHGAAGIGLARARAYALLKKTIYNTYFHHALQRTRTDLVDQGILGSHALCHGVTGNAEIILQAYAMMKDETHMKWLHEIADHLIAWKTEGNKYVSGHSVQTETEDQSLFMGTAGIGYFMLRLHDQRVLSVLSPQVSAQYQGKELPNKPMITVPEITKPENHELDMTIQSNALLFIKDHINQKKLAEINNSNKNRSEVTLFLDPFSRFDIKRRPTIILRKAMPLGIFEQEINEFCYSVLMLFKSPLAIGTALTTWLSMYAKEMDSSTVEKMKPVVLQQIEDAIGANILLITEK